MAKINLKVVTDIKQSKEELDALSTSIKSIAESLSSVKVDKNLTAQINALTKYYNAVAKAAEKVTKVNYHNQIQDEKLAQAKAKTGKAIAAETKEMNAANLVRQKTIKATNDEKRAQEKHEAQMKKSTEQRKKSTDATQKHSQSIASMIPNILKWQVAMTAVMLPLRKAQEALESINETLVETEKRVVSLQRVAGQAANANEIYDLAQKYGQTFDNVADVVENLVKSGYTWEESLKAAESALLAINVAELDAAQATEGLIAIVKQYGMELEDLNYIQGVLNKTADNAAVTTEKLLIALQKTGSTAKNANIDFEETVGLITALSEGTAASGQNIGNALRSLIVFTSDSKALDSFAGLSSGMAETVKNYRAGKASILDIWKGLGGELQGMNSQKGTLEDLFGGAELTADIESQLTQITDSFAEIYGTAGNYRQNYFIALLDNIAKVEDATKELGDATTYSQKENQKYLDTYEAKVNALDAKWQKLANDEQGFLAFKKGMIDVASDLLTAVDSVGGLGGLLNAAIAILTPFLLKWTITFGASAISAAKAGIVSLFTTIKAEGLAANATLGLIGVVLGGISLAISAAQANTQKWHESNQKAISDWESIKEETAALDALYKEYQQLTPAAKEYAEVEKSLVTALGEKAESLKILKENTDDYREALKNLAEQELKDARTKYTSAQKAAENELKQVWFDPYIHANVYEELGLNLNSKTKSVLQNAGVKTFSNGIGSVGIEGIVNDGSAESVVNNYNLYKDAAEKVLDEYYRALNRGDKEYANQVWSVYKDLDISEVAPLVEKYLSTRDTLEDILSRLQEIEDETEKTEGNVSNINKDLSELSDTTLKGIVDKLRAARDATKDTFEYEEKKKAVLEAEQALLDAQNNRTTRVLNSATGQWEWLANERDVENAREKLEEARLAVEDAAYNQIISDLESGNLTNQSILTILANWQSAYGSGDFSHVSNDIKGVLREAGVDVDMPTSSEIDEIINGNVSPQQFFANLKEFGVLVGSSIKNLFSPSGTSFWNQNTSNDSHNSYYINGVRIGMSEAKKTSILDLFENMALFDDNNF